MLHALNTVLRHMEKMLNEKNSLVFKYIRFISKHFGSRRPKNHRLLYMQFMRNAGRWNQILPIPSLTGVRFLEIVNSADKILLQFQAHNDFIATLPDNDELKVEFEQLGTCHDYQWLKVDLFVIMLLNVSHFQICYKAIVDPSAKVNSYKQILEKFVAIFRLDAEEVFDLLQRPQDLPFFAPFFQPSTLQQEIMDQVTDFSVAEKQRAISVINLLKDQMVDSILKTNATLVSCEFEGVLQNCQLHNNQCERSFGLLKHVERTKENLSFIYKETTVVATSNNFFSWFEKKTAEEQAELWYLAQNKWQALMKIIKANEKLEDEIQLAESRKREEFNVQKKLLCQIGVPT